MKLRLIHESADIVEKLADLIIPAAGNTVAVRKLLRFAGSGHALTDYSEAHSMSTFRRELMNGQRLVGLGNNSHKDESGDGLYVVPFGNDNYLVSLPENSDIIELILSMPLAPALHAVRGIAFGYEPTSVYSYSIERRLRQPWKKYLRSLNIPLAENDGGYASVADERHGYPNGSIIVWPENVAAVQAALPKLGQLKHIDRYCPECNAYVDVWGSPNPDNINNDICHHDPNTSSNLHPMKRAYYTFEFDISSIMDQLEPL